MFIVTISNWRRKLIILVCLVFLAMVFSIGANYSNNTYTVMVLEEVFNDPIVSSAEAVRVEGGDIIDGEYQEQEVPNNENLEQEFEKKEPEKGFWQTILEKFRRE